MVLCLSGCQPRRRQGRQRAACQPSAGLDRSCPTCQAPQAACVPQILLGTGLCGVQDLEELGMEDTLVLALSRDFIVNLFFGFCFHQMRTAELTRWQAAGLCSFKFLKFLAL